MSAGDDSDPRRRSAAAHASDAGLAAPPPPAEILRPGMQLNGVYEIDALIARGGMGEVYRAHSIQTNDAVAIKVIRADLAENETAIALFRNEASKLHRLHNEAIIRYYVFSVDPVLQRTYLAMEFVEGESLAQMLQRGPMPAKTVRRLAERIALGLHAAHRRDIIHRDVSPDNIIICNKDVDEAKIIDFGIARSTEAGTTLIDIGFAGKLGYVSPEQLGYHGGEVGPRSDIYSLGVVLAEALRGASLDLGGTQVEVIEKRKRPPNLDGVDRRLLPIIEKMLQTDPAARQQSMQEVADDFAAVNLDEPARRFGAPPPPQLQPRLARAVGAPAQGRSALAPIVGGAAAVVALAAGAAYWIMAPAPPHKSAPDAILRPAEGEGAGDPTLQGPSPETGRAPPREEPAKGTAAGGTAPDAGAPRESALGFVSHYDGGPCFAILSSSATPSSARIEAIGADRHAFEQLNAAFARAVGFEAEVKAVLATQPQCAAVDFFAAARRNAAFAPQAALDTPFLRPGELLTGAITAAKDRRLEALLIGDDGTMQNVTNALAWRQRDFGLSAPRSKSPEPQLLLLVSSAAPLSALKPGKPAKAGPTLAAASAEAAEKQDPLGVALAYFYVTD